MDGSFNLAAQHEEPALFDIHRGSGPVLFLFQHSGYAVPKKLHDAQGRPLGLPPQWFDPKSTEHRHEASDWGTFELADALAKLMPKASFIRANYARLIVDLNRKRSAGEVIPSSSSEYTDQLIPGNLGLSLEAREQRLHEFYDPYHQAVEREIARIKQKYGYVIVIDLHSFTPVWLGQRRNVEIGTLYTAENPLARALNAALDKQAPQRFTPNAPYVLADRDDNGGHAFEREHGLDYAGIEIRQDLLDTQEGRKHIARIIARATQEVRIKLTPSPETKQRTQFEAVYA